MAKGHKTGGRKPGSKNKVSEDVRACILHVYAEIGGNVAFAKWARTNQTEFYKIHSKLIPKDINLSGALRLEDLLGGGEDPDNVGGDS